MFFLFTYFYRGCEKKLPSQRFFLTRDGESTLPSLRFPGDFENISV